MTVLNRLKKTVEALKAITRGRHPASPGVAAKPAADPGTPPDRPHIRDDAMKEVNFRMEKAIQAPSLPTPDPDGKSVMEERERHLQSTNTPHVRQRVGGKPQVEMDKSLDFTDIPSTKEEVDQHIDRTCPHANKPHRNARIHALTEGQNWIKTKVPLSAISEKPHSIRDVNKYRKMIREGKEPPTVVLTGGKHPDGSYYVFSVQDGAHRIAALRAEGRTHVDAFLGTHDLEKSEPGTPPIASKHADNNTLTWKTRLGAIVGALRKAAPYDPRKEVTGFEDPEELAELKGRHKKELELTPSAKMLGLFGSSKEKPSPKKTTKILTKNADKGVSNGGTPSLISLLKKADKISEGILEQANPESAYQGKAITPIKSTAYKRRFEIDGKNSNDPQLLILPKANFDKIETIKTPEGLYHHVGTKGNHQYHTVSFSSNPEVSANAGVITAESNGKRHLRAAFSASGSNVYLDKLNDYMKANDVWKHEPALSINSREHAEKGWEGHHSDLIDGLVPDKTLQAPPATVSKWISFAGKEGDSTPRVVAKEALENFDAEKGVDQMKRSYFGHPTFTTAHREAAYGKLASDVFNLGQYVPRTTTFRHPLSNRPWSAMEFIPGAKPVSKEDAPEKLKELKENGDIYKMAIMNMVLGNNDRHMNNILLDPAGKAHLIDHGLTFDFSHIATDVLPQYAEHVLDEPIPESVHQWLWSLDATKLANELHKMGAPVPVVMNAVGRLADARGWSNLVKHGSRVYSTEIKHSGLRYLLETMKARQFGIPVETRHDIQEKIRHNMTGIKPVVKKDAADDKTVKMDEHPVNGTPTAQHGEATVKIDDRTGKASIVHPTNETALRHSDAVDTRRNKE